MEKLTLAQITITAEEKKNTGIKFNCEVLLDDLCDERAGLTHVIKSVDKILTELKTKLESMPK